jgi:hypothetical protein
LKNMERKVWQTFATATALYFASAAPGYAEELPLPTSAEDVAATINDLASTAVAVPEAPPAPPVEVAAVTPVTTAPPPAPEAPPPQAETPQAPTESQYQEPEPQYHPSTTDGSSAPEEAVQAVADVVPTASPDPAPTLAEQSPPAADMATGNSSASSLPSTWIWNWNWNCDPANAPPEQNTVADGTWTWNWNFNCNPANAPPGSGQYQGTPTQYQPGNTNISIRIASPGDNGPVTQTIAAVAQATTAVANTITQTVVQETTGALVAPPQATGSSVPDPGTVVAQVVTAVSEVVAAVLPSTVALPPTVTALPLPAIVPWPTSVAVPPHLGELLGELGVLPPKPKPSIRPSVKTRSRPAPARLPQPAYGVGFASAWGGSQVPAVAAAAGRRASTAAPPAHSPRPGPRRPVPLPAPGGTSLAGTGGNSAAGVAAAAIAALLASYLLIPPFGAWRVRSPRDRRRLRPRSSRLERPG